jgi:non-heme chloroperoxidase
MPTLEREAGRRIYYEHHPGARRPVMLIHGWGMSARVWDTTTAALIDAGHAVVAFDQRGCGQSDKDFRTVSIEAGAADVCAIVTELRLTGVVVNGWSLGGAIAVAAAARLGPLCAGVVLTGGATPRYTSAPDFPHGGTPEGVAGTVAALRANRTPFLRQLAGVVCAQDPGAGVVDWLWQIFMQTSPNADAALAELAHSEQRALLANLAVPVLSIIGSADGFVAPEIGRVAATVAAQGRCIEYAGCGHAPFLEAPERYRADLAAFLAELR